MKFLENEIKNQENNKNNNIIPEINIIKKPSTNIEYSSTNKIINSINPVNRINVNNNRINRIKESIDNENKRFRGRNTSMEHINPKFCRDIIMSDADLTGDEENYVFRKNNIYFRPNKYNSPKSFNNIFNQQFKSNNNDNIYTKRTKYNNYYFYSKENDNLDEMSGNHYNNNYQLKYQKPNNELLNRSSCKYNSTFSYDNKPNKFNLYNYDNQTKTIDEIFLHKSIMNANNRINKNLITNKDISYDDYTYSNNLNTIRNSGEINKSQKMRRNYSVMEENDVGLSPYKNYFNTNCNYLDDLKIFRSNRRSLNNVRIVKKNSNTSIQEYNLSVGDDTDNRKMDINMDMDADMNRYENKFFLNKKNIRKAHNLNNNMNRSMNENFNLKKYYDNYSKNIQPISNSQLNINGTAPCNYKMPNFISKMNYNVQIDENCKNNNMSSPNFNIIGKSPKNLNHINEEKLKSSNNEISADSITISNKNNDENNKMPKNDIRSSSKDIRGKDTSTKNINKNVNKNINDFKICYNEKINYFGIEKVKKDINENKTDNINSNINDSNNENKFVFENENDIIDYIYNKFEEERKKKNYFNRKLRFTGFVLSKKYKGKNLCDIRIEDDVDKINQQLKDEQILIGDKKVEFRFCEDKKGNPNADYENKINKINNELNELMEQNRQLKIENEKLNKKDIVKNDLIKKLDKEKENLIEEIEKLKEEIEKLKNNGKKDEDKLINIELKNIDNDLNDKDVDVDITINKKFNIKANNLNSENRNNNIKHNFKEIIEKIKSSKQKKNDDGIINKKY